MIDKNKKEVDQRVKDVLPVLEKMAKGDFTQRIKMVDGNDALSKLFVSINLILDDLAEMKNENVQNSKYSEELNSTLEGLIQTKIRLAEENSSRFKLLLDNLPMGVAVYEVKNQGKDFVFLDMNVAGQKIDKVKSKDIVGKNVEIVFPGVKKFGLLAVMKRVWKTGKPEKAPVTEYEDEKIKGWRENYIYKLPTGEIVSLYSDLTEQKQREMMLIEEEARYELAMKGTSDGLWDWNLKTNKVFYSPMWKKMLGYKDSEISDSFDEFVSRIHPEDRDRVDKYVKDFLANKLEGEFKMELRMRHKDKTWVDILARASLLKDAKGKPSRLIGTHVDMTRQKSLDRQQAEQIAQLQKMNEFMVERELKMIELKNKLKAVTNK